MNLRQKIKTTVSLLILSVFLAGCGADGSTVYVNNAREFEGRFLLDNGGFIEIVQDGEKQVTLLRENQLLVSVNPENGTLAQHPKVRRENLHLVAGAIFVPSFNANYTSGHDVEEDVSGNNIRGKRRTDIRIIRTTRGIEILIEIYSDKINNNANRVVATRVIKGTL
jgi:hypothetical protein